MHREQRLQTQALLKAEGIEQALFAKLDSVKWLTGFAPPVQTGPNFFAGGPPIVWYEDGHFTLIAVDSYAADVEAVNQNSDCSGVTYLGYTIEQAIDSQAQVSSAFRQTLASAKGRGGKVGIELTEATALHLNLLREMLPDGTDFVSIDGWLEPLRMVKTEEELAKLRENFALTDIGHIAARRAVSAGQREIDVWTEIHTAVNRAAGQRVPLGNDCAVGHRQANIGGWPLDYEIRPNDSFIVDLSTILHGYWSDSCATYYANEPTAQQKTLHGIITDALAFGASLLRPGAVAKEIDRKLRQFIAEAGYPVYPHHSGHGVGVSGHEAPRIVPYNDEVLQEGMVILLEPGIYLPGETGVRLEDAYLITADGAEVLTQHDKSLP